MKIYNIICFLLLLPFHVISQNTITTEEPEALTGPLLKGVHIGVVQPLYSIKDGRIQHQFDYRDYSIGLPIGLSFRSRGGLIFDLEMVPFVSQLPDEGVDLRAHLLYHPGVILDLGSGFAFGCRLAFETGIGQYGFTPLLNKSFKAGLRERVFLEVLAPGRVGPGFHSRYTQFLAVHAGIMLE